MKPSALELEATKNPFVLYFVSLLLAVRLF